jgi:hypothetical protein
LDDVVHAVTLAATRAASIKCLACAIPATALLA